VKSAGTGHRYGLRIGGARRQGISTGEMTMNANLPEPPRFRPRRHARHAEAVACLSILAALLAAALPPARAAAAAETKADASATAAPNASSSKYFRMKLVKLIDKQALNGPTPAIDLMIPTDWKFDGRVGYNTGGGCFADVAQVSFDARSADGALVLEGFPTFTWQYSDDPRTQRALIQDNQQMSRYGRKPCPVAPPATAADFLAKAVLPKYRSGKTAASIEPLPEFADIIRQRFGLPPQGQQAASAQGGQNGPRIDAARALLRYEMNGQPVEEWVTAVTITSASPAGGGQRAFNYDNHAALMMALRAPQGKLQAQDKLFKLIASTIHAEPQWQAQVGQMIAQVTQMDQMRKQRNAQMINDFQQREIATINGVTQNAQRGADASFAAFDQNIRNVQTYRDPNTGQTFELSNQYNHAWLNGNNEYIMSDDHSFNPNASLNGNWTELEPVKP
jgi:hypothetical protein